MKPSSEFKDFQNITRRPHPKYYLKKSKELVYVVYTDGIVRSSVCLGNYNEVEPYVGNIQLRNGYWRYLSKDFGFKKLLKLKKEMTSHVHILVKESNGDTFGLEIGFQQQVSSFADYLESITYYLHIGLEPRKPENHGMGYHFHLINKKGRTNVITMFNSSFNTLLGEYHAEGSCKGGKIDVAKLGNHLKKQIYNDCCTLGQKIKIGDYKICGKGGFIFYP